MGAQRRVRFEQQGLGLEVVRHGGVKVEVVAGEVGETTDREVGAVDPAQRQRVTRHLHDHRVHAALGHRGEHRLQRGGLRSRQRAGDVGAVDADADGADQPGRAPASAQAGLDKISRGGLARRSGDPDDRHPVRRVSVHRGGQAAEHAAGRGVHQRRHGLGSGTGLSGHLGDPGGVGEHRDRAAFDRVAGIPGAVRQRAGQRGEEVTGQDVLGAQGHAGHRQVGDGRTAIRVVCRHRPDLSRQRRQRHTVAGAGAQPSGHRHHLSFTPPPRVIP